MKVAARHARSVTKRTAATRLLVAKRSHYELDGDIKGPLNPYLEFTVHAGRTRTDIVARALRSAVLQEHEEDGAGQVFRFSRLEVRTKPRVRVYADNFLVGRTPATITVETSALKVLLPR